MRLRERWSPHKCPCPVLPVAPAILLLVPQVLEDPLPQQGVLQVTPRLRGDEQEVGHSGVTEGSNEGLLAMLTSVALRARRQIPRVLSQPSTNPTSTAAPTSPEYRRSQWWFSAYPPTWRRTMKVERAANHEKTRNLDSVRAAVTARRQAVNNAPTAGGCSVG
eukprot:CAMPEP_0204360550 /NCGR_PEP_ID=MMETSP0469-20131031/38136_1 /ASSEMBLY_ACC=CAM_ASM_000384 /TAXON_ID=2969 /ORGANISM="Oxyrrhis marina" /LENGTH=162 /DNA_ID=CAMNT_0051348795 /DNA_START=983 /DNA_END=1472 /DNA_ORIENTATION=+